MADADVHDPGQTGTGLSAALRTEGGASPGRRGVPPEIGEVSFPVSVRGYDRGAVDAYVNRVRELFEELEATRSPEAAVKHALDRVGEQTKGLLAGAGETAEQITVAARNDAEETTARAKRDADDTVANANAEAAEIVGRARAEAEATVAQAQNEAAEHAWRSQEEIAALRGAAEARVRELDAETETIRQERDQLLTDLRRIASRVEEVASAARTRFPPPEKAARTEEENRDSRTAGKAEATEVNETDVPTDAATRRPWSD